MNEPSVRILNPDEAMTRALPGAGVSSFDDDGQEVEYTAFDGTIYNLHQFQGRYVRLLLPDSWITGADAMTTEERRIFIDRSDIVYEYYKEIILEEPGGDGLLPIAIVTATCGSGCGYVGWKGVEIADNVDNLNNITDEIASGFETNGLMIHELGHNFDVHSQYHHYTVDHGHAWTGFWDPTIRYYGRAADPSNSPNDVVRLYEGFLYGPYYTDPTADWESCVRDELCTARGIVGRDAWAGVTLRYAALHTMDDVLDAMEFMSAYADANPPPVGAEALEDLHIEMLAAGAEENLGCFVDEWRWYASAALRAEMDTLYGLNNADCEDGDGDGVSPLQGDCNDADPNVSPAMIETMNGIDDDCNDIVDDLLITEPVGGDFPDPQLIDNPSKIEGSISDAADTDRFDFNVSTPQTVKISITSRNGFSGWVFVIDDVGGWYDYQYVGLGETSIKSYYLPSARLWRFEVALNVESSIGDYEITLQSTDTLPFADWGEVIDPTKVGDSYILISNMLTLDSRIVYEPPTQIRFWVTGVGIVGTVPYADTASLVWTPPADLEMGTLGVRAQLMTDTKPVSDFTQLTWFDYVAPCTDDSQCDDGDACTVDSCNLITGECVNTSADCDDGDACTIDACDPDTGSCVNTGVDCDDGDACTIDACDPDTGSCVNTPDNDVYEAETMYHSTGNAYADGWNIYSNGYISFNHTFNGGTQQMTVRASGQEANGWPNMTVTVGGTQVYNVYVNPSGWNDYTFSFAAPVGSREVRINFTNDYYQPPLDRNLFVDKVTVHCNGPGPGPGSLVASIVVQDDWGTGYCAHLDITNNGALPTSDWTVVINSFDSNVNQYWNTPAISGTGTHSVKWTDPQWNRIINPGTTYSQTGFCALRAAGTSTMPAVVSVQVVY